MASLKDQSEEINKRLVSLKSSNESIQSRLKAFEEIVKLSELFNLTEYSINVLLQSTLDLYQTEHTPIEHRKQAFEHLQQLIQKKPDRFESLMLRNIILTLVFNSSLINPSASRLFNANSQQSSQKAASSLSSSSNNNHSNSLNNSSLTSSINGEDIKCRFNLFLLIVKNGTHFKNLDQNIAYECLSHFLNYSQFLNDRTYQIFELFKNLITNKNLIYLREDLLIQLTKFILNFSFLLTKQSTNNKLVSFTKQQQSELKCCVELIDKLIEHLSSIKCVNHLVVCLCELLDLTWQSTQTSNKAVDTQTNRMNELNESIIAQIYECMSKLFSSPIGHCALFAFFSEIFVSNKKHQLHKASQINGALMHIKQLFEDFKQSKLKNTVIIKELHLNTLMYLPILLKTCSKENQQSQSYLFEQILSLTLHLVHLASRDIFMCLLTLNSRKFLIEILDECSMKIQNNDKLLKKYADLLNLLDKKDLFSYKTPNANTSTSGATNILASSNRTLSSSSSSFLQSSSLVSSPLTNPSPSGIGSSSSSSTSSTSGTSSIQMMPLFKSNSVATGSTSQTAKEIEEMVILYQQLKDKFYELVYKFPNSNLLNENCINNCIELYLQRKILPCHDKECIKEIKILLDKYFNFKNCHNIAIQRHTIESLQRKLDRIIEIDYEKIDLKLFKEEVIMDAILPAFEENLQEDLFQLSPNTLLNSDGSFNMLNANQLDLIEMKSFIVNKLMEFATMSEDDSNLLKIVNLFERIILSDRLNNELLTLISLPTNFLQTPAASSPQSTITGNQSILTNQSPLNPQSQPSYPKQNYLSKSITCLIDLFERYFNSSHKFTYNPGIYTECLIRIYDILIRYLDSYYKSLPNISITVSNASVNTTESTNPITAASNQLASLLNLSGSAQSLKRTASLLSNSGGSFDQQQGVLSPSSSTSITNPNMAKLNSLNASIRKDIFDFLLRIKSGFYDDRVHFACRSSRRKSIESKYLLLCLNQCIDPQKANRYNCLIDYGKVLRLVELCLDKETDSNVTLKVLNELPFILQYEMDLIKSEMPVFIDKLFIISKRELNTLKNKPESLKINNQIRQEFISKYHTLLASLILYNTHLERTSQDFILHSFTNSISTSRFCLEALTTTISEMQEINTRQCAEILLKLSQFSSSQSMAQPVLEFLSTLNDLKRLNTNDFSYKDFITVPIIATKYLDPYKFNSFIILLAHYVICIWFLKCKPEYRKSYASLICKAFNEEVVAQLNKSIVQTTNKEALKSPNKPDSFERQMSSDESKNPIGSRVLTDNMRQFYKELTEIALDFMSNNFYFNINNTQLNSLHNQNELIVDIFSNSASTNSSLRSNILLDSKDKKSLSRSWIIGNKIVQITTGLFSGICNEDDSLPVPRKQRPSTSTTSNSNNNSKVSFTVTKALSNQIATTAKPKTAAMMIPNAPQSSLVASSMASTTTTNDSVASSANSSASANINNSILCSPTLSYGQNTSNIMIQNNSNNTTTSTLNTTASAANANNESKLNNDESSNFNKANETPNADLTTQHQISETSDVLDVFNKDIIGEDQCDELASSKPKTQQKQVKLANAKNTKTNSIKRRYKSGLPSTLADRGDDDLNLNEDICLNQYNDSYTNKLSKPSYLSCSKDDSDISTASSLLKNGCEEILRNSHLNRNSDRMNYHRSGSSGTGDHSQGKLSNIDQLGLNNNGTKETCHPSCWCNSLVEITCKYPTKVVSYVSLVENNTSSSHELNMASISAIIQQQLQMMHINNEKLNNPTQANQNQQQVSLTPLDSIRRNKFLTRISESSAMNSQYENFKSFDDTEFSQKESSLIIDEEMSKSPFRIAVKRAESERTNIINEDNIDLTKELIASKVTPRKSSLDYNDIKNASSTNTSSLQHSQPNQQQQQQTNQQLSSSYLLAPIFQLQSSLMQSTSQNALSIDPSQVFLQLFQGCQQNEGSEQPILIPEDSLIQNSINMLDYQPCYLIHKIGVIYIGKNQISDEKAILSNTNGSLRYKQFINGLGNLIRLKDMDTKSFYPGGLETDGSAGEFTILWFDGIVQVVFHVVTMMPNSAKEEYINFKKKHIGNDSVIIVYNESGEDYQFGTIKGDVNCVCIDIEPLKSNTNIVRMKASSELAPTPTFAPPWSGHQEPKFISDQNLAFIVRKMALHADLATRVHRFQKDGIVYGGKWYERLKQINRIRKNVKEFYLNQAAKNNASSNKSNISTINSNQQRSSISTSNQIVKPFETELDFTVFI